MPKIRNDSPLGDLEVPLLRRIVKAGEVVEVSEEHAEMLLPQEIWSAADNYASEIQVLLDNERIQAEVHAAVAGEDESE